MKLAQFRKGKLIGGILACIFSIWHLLHSIFFLKIYNNYHLSAILYNSRDEVEKIKSLFENINNVIYFLLCLILLVVVILLFICHNKNKIKILKKNEVKTKLPVATSLIIAGTLFSFGIGFTGLGLHTVVNDLLIFVGGIFLIVA